MLRRIAKSKMSSWSKRHRNSIIAHYAHYETDEPLCLAALPAGARWLGQSDEGYRAERDCLNCRDIARRCDLELDFTEVP